MTLNQPTTHELADFVRHEGAKKAAQLLGVSTSAVCHKLNRAGIWMRGRKSIHHKAQSAKE